MSTVTGRDIQRSSVIRSMVRLARLGVGLPVVASLDPEDLDWPDLIVAARRHELVGEVARGASLLGWEVPDPLRTQVERQTRWAMRRANVTHLALEALGSAGIDALTFKGLALAAMTRPDPWVRTAVDVDILVTPDSMRDSVRVLLRAGASVAPGYPEPDESLPFRLYRRLRHELTLSLNGVHVDLHWRLGIDRALLPPAEVALSRAQQIDVGGGCLGTLHPCDALLQSCLHWSSDKSPRLKNPLDIVLLDGMCETASVWMDPRVSRAQSELVRISRALVGIDYATGYEAARSRRGRAVVRRTYAIPRSMPVVEERIRSFGHHITAPWAWQDRAAHPGRLASRLLLEQHRRFRAQG